MHQRSGDEVWRTINGWEEMRADFGPDAPHSIADYIEEQIAKLRNEMSMRDKPLPEER